MKTRKIQSAILALALVASLLLACFGSDGSLQVQAASGSAPSEQIRGRRGVALPSVVTTITVNSTTDPDTSLSTTCSTAPCTLRRAIVQARNTAKPVVIAFTIPTSDPGYNATLQIWKIQLQSTAVRYLNGDITIDGSTQPNGRATGPKIILVGAGTGGNDGLKLGESAGQNNNTLRGLGFQNFLTHVYVNTNGNLIENNWFGLSDNGSLPYLRAGNAENGSGSAGVALSAGVDLNIIQNNYFLGFDGVAVALRGEDTTFQNNKIGTKADGQITGKQTAAGLLCSTVDWLGGGGISMEGPRQIVQNNIIAGLRQEISGTSTQPDAITVQSTCDDCQIISNKIGLDAVDHEIGVCGQGIDISNTERVIIRSNTLVDTYHAAIFINGVASDANTLSRNLIRRSTPWLLPSGATKADDAILRYSGLPDAFEFFNPAKVTSINGTVVSGSAGTGSACPSCIIELFLDDNDSIKEALQYLGTTTAHASTGNWSFTLAAPLAPGTGIRTTSTTAIYNTIPAMNAGTTVGLSAYYSNGYKVYLPQFKK